MKFSVKEEASLLNFLYKSFPEQSRTSVKDYLKDGRVLINGNRTTAFDWPLRVGDTVEVTSKDVAKGARVSKEATKKVADLGLDIVYEDEHLIVVDKPSGMPTIATKSASTASVHRDTGIYGGRERTAYSILTDYRHSQGKAQHLTTGHYGARGSNRIWIVHRLDKGTSGLLVFAKDERTKDLMQSKWNDLVLERKYIGIIEGEPEDERGTVSSYLYENPKSLKMVSTQKAVTVLEGQKADAQKAITHYQIIGRQGPYSRAEFDLETGRKNQIRVHCADDLQCPIAGDHKYGAKSDPIKRLALHATSLIFRNPWADGPEILEFHSPAPKSFDHIK